MHFYEWFAVFWLDDNDIMFSLTNVFLFCLNSKSWLVFLFPVSSLNQVTNDLRLKLGKMDNNGVIRGASSILSVHMLFEMVCFDCVGKLESRGKIRIWPASVWSHFHFRSDTDGSIDEPSSLFQFLYCIQFFFNVCRFSSVEPIGSRKFD